MNHSDELPRKYILNWTTGLALFFLTPLAALAAGVLKGILLALPVMLLWNRVLTQVVEVPTTAFLLLLLFQLLGPVKITTGPEKG